MIGLTKGEKIRSLSLPLASSEHVYDPIYLYMCREQDVCVLNSAPTRCSLPDNRSRETLSTPHGFPCPPPPLHLPFLWPARSEPTSGRQTSAYVWPRSDFFASFVNTCIAYPSEWWHECLTRMTCCLVSCCLSRTLPGPVGWKRCHKFDFKVTSKYIYFKNFV